MNSSLESLVANVKKKGIENFKHTSKFYQGEQLDLITRKGVYPYDYMDSIEKFAQEKLPEKKEFYSLLNKCDVSDADYEHAKRVWKKFGIRNMGEYHDLYLKSDVLLLADVFEAFRETSMSAYNLDPCHYLTLPGLAWDSMLKLTKVKLELISDVDTYNFIEKGIRGGVSVISHRYARANNKYMTEYDPEKESSYIIYLDANSLYAWAMSQSLPTGGFKWLNKQKHFDKFKDRLMDLEDSKYGYIAGFRVSFRVA